MKETNLDLDDRTLTLDTPASIDAFCEKYTTYVLKALYGITRKRPISKEISERPGLFEELAKDATTDALVWAINNAHKYDPQRAAVRTWLSLVRATDSRERWQMKRRGYTNSSGWRMDSVSLSQS